MGSDQPSKFDEVFSAYSETVMDIAKTMLRDKYSSEDVFQEVFLRYIKINPRFESKDHETAWFKRVTINCCKKVWDSSWNKKRAELYNDLIIYDKYQDMDLHNAISRLPRIYREAVILYYFDGISIGKIGEILNVKQSTIRSRLTRARSRLRNDDEIIFNKERHI